MGKAGLQALGLGAVPGCLAPGPGEVWGRGVRLLCERWTRRGSEYGPWVTGET